MACRQCASENLTQLSSEIAVHLPKLGIPHVFLFPVLLVCLNCGFSEFVMSEAEVRSVIDGLTTPEKKESAGAA